MTCHALSSTKKEAEAKLRRAGGLIVFAVCWIEAPILDGPFGHRRCPKRFCSSSAARRRVEWPTFHFTRIGPRLSGANKSDWNDLFASRRRRQWQTALLPLILAIPISLKWPSLISSFSVVWRACPLTIHKASLSVKSYFSLAYRMVSDGHPRQISDHHPVPKSGQLDVGCGQGNGRRRAWIVDTSESGGDSEVFLLIH